MKHLLISLVCGLPLAAQSGGHESSWRIGMDYTVEQPVKDPALKNNEAVLDLVFQDNLSNTITGKIKLSFNGTEKTVSPNAKGNYSLKLTPGKYKFQFWYNDKFSEIFTDSIPLSPATRTALTTHFRSSDTPVICFKPVVYLYPQQNTEVNVKIDLGQGFDFTYPQYTTEGWTVMAHPDGTLQQGEKTFGYLFWEGPVNFEAKDIDHSVGFVVHANELTSFFENKLAQLGLNGKEIQDYITYWVPRLQTQPRHFIRFLVNEAFDHYAPMTVSPQPDHILRVFMLSRPLQENENIYCTEQELPTFQRQGFTVVEWGGTVIEKIKL